MLHTFDPQVKGIVYVTVEVTVSLLRFNSREIENFRDLL